MKTLTGGILILAASILVAAETIAYGLVNASGRGYHMGGGPMLAFLVGLVGLVVLIYGLSSEGPRPPVDPQDPGEG